MPKVEYYDGGNWVSVGTVSSITAGTGLSGGTITGSGTINLSNTTVISGTYSIPTIVVNQQGQITSASSIGLGLTNQILQTNGTSLFWGKYLSSPNSDSICLSDNNKIFSGAGNSGLGCGVLSSTTSASYNTAIGKNVLLNNTIGSFNSAIGFESLKSCSSGTYNTAIGYQSSTAITTGDFNTSIGSRSLIVNSTGSENSCLGMSSMSSNTIGIRNSSIGFSSLSYNTSGSNNTSIGSYSGTNNITGGLNTFLGHKADVSIDGIVCSTAIGVYSKCSSSNSIVLGGQDTSIGLYYPNVGIGINSPIYSLHVSNTSNPSVCAIGIDNTVNTPSVLSNGSVLYSSGGDLYVLTQNNGSKKISSGYVSSVGISGSTGISVSGSPITSSGTISLSLNSELQGISGLSVTGFISRTGIGSYSSRTLTSGSGISITNGNGVSGNPTISVSSIDINYQTTGQLNVSRINGYPSSTISFLRGDGSWISPYINSLQINGNVNLVTYDILTSGNINATTGTLKANNISSHNSNSIVISTPIEITAGTSKCYIKTNSNYLDYAGKNTYNSTISTLIETNAANETCSIVLNGDYMQFINPLDTLGFIFTDEDNASFTSYVSYINASGQFISSSSSTKTNIRKKQNIGYLERLSRINVYSFSKKYDLNENENTKKHERKIKKSKLLHVGLMADELLDIFDNAVNIEKFIDDKEENNIKIPKKEDLAINYNVLICYIILALQELNNKIK